MPNRCSHCKQVGHNRARCPHDAWYAVQLRETYNAARRAQEYTINERKVYTNACQEVEYKAHLELLLSKEVELLELFDLFLQGGNHREKVLINRREGLRDIFKPKIAEAKKQLKNCENRLNYNIARC